ncbi:hypothetical protein LV89_01822 [Arcicella aurantiaca]|uniref:Uncharacterized protein n=1 Tax=Arcicella aurantiaca TaxID=591202 RepID=A0A316E931_9BACT|nr:hypothetical protein [Arcicella aurantiaca]PWK27010.1 hypothetical protein LV89_01822 [Arcicella aurantiaca]
MKILQKMKFAMLSAMTLIASQNEVAAYFLGPAAGVAYTEAFLLGEGQVAGDLTDNTKGKQILISRGTKAQIIAWDTDATAASATPPRTPAPHWFAPTKEWCAVVFNGSATDFTTNLDLNSSDLVFGNGETVTLTYTLTTKIPFKKEGKKIVYDAALGGVTTPTAINGLQNNVVSGTDPSKPAVEPTDPALGNDSKTGLAAIAWWGWGLIVVGLIGIGLILKKVLGGGKSGKVVKK